MVVVTRVVLILQQTKSISCISPDIGDLFITACDSNYGATSGVLNSAMLIKAILLLLLNHLPYINHFLPHSRFPTSFNYYRPSNKYCVTMPTVFLN